MRPGSTQPSADQRFRAAAELHQRGALDLATTQYNALLRDHPGHADALHMLGLIALQQGQVEVGIERIGRSLERNPRQPMALANLARALNTAGRPDRAVASLGEALRMEPDFADGWLFRAALLADQGRSREALADYSRALALQPGNAAALNNRGNLHLQNGDAVAALADYEAAIRLLPGFAEAHNNLCSALLELNDPLLALASADRALALRADFAEAHNNRGNALRALRQSRQALACFEQALSLRPEYPEALSNLCGALLTLKRHDLVAPLYGRLLAIAPNYPFAMGSQLHAQLQCCDWTHYAERIAEVRYAVMAGARADYPWSFLCAGADPPAQLQCARIYVRHKCPVLPSPSPAASESSTRLRVAYLSSDFGEHPVTQLAAGVFAAHDRQRFDVLGISLSAANPRDVIQQQMSTAFSDFHNIAALDDAAAAAFIARLGVHVIIDLNGHTMGARPGLLALRPAPVQACYLGYAGTTGAPWIDYLIADAVVIPRGEAGYSERIVRLPGCFLPRDDRQIVAASGTRATAGLPEHGFVFCAFNASYKLTPLLFDVWMRLLQRVPDSVLWLRRPADVAVENLRKEAAARDVDPDRLVFATRVNSLEAHLARLRLADLFLDTQPYNAHTTASDALYVGLPVLTCRGSTFAGRVAESLLIAAGLVSLVAANLDEYEHIALRLAMNTGELASLRARVVALRGASPVFDTGRYTRRLEIACQMMFRRACAGEPPADIDVPAA